MSLTLLAAKFKIPFRPAGLIARPRLLTRLDSAFEMGRPAVLVSAPAGFGKTILLSDWAAQRPRPFAWLTLDARDQDPARFWAHVITAYQARFPGLANALLEELRSPAPPDARAFLPELINEIDQLPGTAGLVLDDYQTIQNPRIHASLADFIESAPPNLMLAIAAHTQPALPLDRLRDQGLLFELGVEDLRFNSAETGEYIEEFIGIRLPRWDARDLAVRTGGQAAALHLTGLALWESADPRGWIDAFTGGRSGVLDTLVDEVLSILPDAVQDFLLKTSILDQLCAALCDHVTGDGNSKAALAFLKWRDQLVLPVDDGSFWHRYHPLFASLVRLRLEQEYPDQVQLLHRRASEWYAQAGLTGEAISHALRGGDLELAAGLVSSHWQPALLDGRAGDVARWIDALPDRVVSASTLLSTAKAWALWLLGRPAAAEVYLRNAAGAISGPPARGVDVKAGGIKGGPEDGMDARTLEGQVAALESLAAARRGEPAAAVQLAGRALSLLPERERLARKLVLLNQAGSMRELGLVSEAIEAYHRLIADMAGGDSSGGDLPAAASAVYHLGKLYQVQGRLHAAHDLYQRWLQQAERESGGLESGGPGSGGPGQRLHPSLSLLPIGLGELFYAWDEPALAAEWLALSWEIGKRCASLDMIKNHSILAAHLLCLHGDLEGALVALEEAASAEADADAEDAAGAEADGGTAVQENSRLARVEIAAWQARFQARAGLLEQAERWLETAHFDLSTGLGYTDCVQAFSAARVLLALGRTEAALDLLNRLDAAAERDLSRGQQIEARLLAALALFQRGEPERASETLLSSLALAEPESYLRLYLDEGEPAKALFQFTLTRLWLSGGENGQRWLKSYAERILARFPAAAKGASTPGGPAKHEKLPAELARLSKREAQVLQLVAEGLTNPEIAERLVVSEGTIKTHVSHIYNKLGVQNRIEAMSVGKELGLA